jgi:protein SCO1
MHSQWIRQVVSVLILGGNLLLGTTPILAADKHGVGPQFALVDQNQQPVTAATLQGRPSLIQFGFTRCPVVCPTTLYEWALLMEEMGPLADQVNFIFVTVDPERDTAQVLKDYVGHFDKRIIALTGSAANIDRIAAGVGAAYSRREQGNDYTMDHTVHAFLLGREWTLEGTIYVGPDAKHDAVINRLRQLVAAKSTR